MKYITLTSEQYELAKPFEKYWRVFKRDRTCNCSLEDQKKIKTVATLISGVQYDNCCHGTFINALQTIFINYEKFIPDVVVKKNKRSKKQSEQSTINKK